MEYASLGSSGLRISRLVMGGYSFSLPGVGPHEVQAVVDAALDCGINAFDTADSYHDGQSEIMVGRAIKGRRDEIVLSTKVGYRVGSMRAEMFDTTRGPEPDYSALWDDGITPNSWGLSRKHIIAAAEASLRRLGTDYIDIYHTHYVDDRTPLEETLGALDDLVRQGKVRYIGCSAAAGWQLMKAMWAADTGGFESYRSVQMMINLLFRHPARELCPAAQSTGVAVLAFSTLAGGLLTGRYDRQQQPDPGSRYAYDRTDLSHDWNAHTLDYVDALRDLAAQSGRRPGDLATGWVLAQPGVTAALIGAERPEEVRQQADAVDRPPTAEELAAAEAIPAPPWPTKSPAQ